MAQSGHPDATSTYLIAGDLHILQPQSKLCLAPKDLKQAFRMYARVTELGEFSPFGPLFLLGNFFGKLSM
jgi:hypothetical protein